MLLVDDLLRPADFPVNRKAALFLIRQISLYDSPADASVDEILSRLWLVSRYLIFTIKGCTIIIVFLQILQIERVK